MRGESMLKLLVKFFFHPDYTVGFGFTPNRES